MFCSPKWPEFPIGHLKLYLSVLCYLCSKLINNEWKIQKQKIILVTKFCLECMFDIGTINVLRINVSYL